MTTQELVSVIREAVREELATAPILLKRQEAMRKLNVSKTTFDKLIRNGIVRQVHLYEGAQAMYSVKELDALIASERARI